jgi:hypothetical protein
MIPIQYILLDNKSKIMTHEEKNYKKKKIIDFDNLLISKEFQNRKIV